MTLQFQIRREDAVAFNLAFFALSPTYQKTLVRMRWGLSLFFAVCEVVLTLINGFDLTHALYTSTFAVGWFLLYPKLFYASIRKNTEKVLAEIGPARLGPYTLTLTDEGLHAVWPLGTITCSWENVTNVCLNKDYLLIFLGAIGYPIQVADIGREAAEQAFALVNEHRSRRSAA